MKDILLTILRDHTTHRAAFRQAADHLSRLLAYETAQVLEKEFIDIETPLAKVVGSQFKDTPVLIPILRSGLAMLFAFQTLYPQAPVGFIGAARDEKTFLPAVYYENFPSCLKRPVIVLEPMIATGGTLSRSIERLIEKGVAAESIIIVSLIASKEGVAFLKEKFPALKLVIAQIDEKLNHHKYIVPGLGDFGDRYFGTEAEK